MVYLWYIYGVSVVYLSIVIDVLCGINVCKWIVNVESLVIAVHQAALNVSLFFVHIARRYLR